MEFFFYIFSLVTIISTIFAIFSKNFMYTLLYLIISFLSTSCVFFSLGAIFAAVIEVIIYAGAIMVLFIFVIMIFDFKKPSFQNIQSLFKRIVFYLKNIFVISISILFISYVLSFFYEKKIILMNISAKLVGIKLFSDYLWVVELSSLVLLCALVIVFHLGKVKHL
ncbi:MAG: NADH-quinone oxidoreductase subunit J [Buchnera aphidicola (Chaetogeoica yunlongensis)]